MSHHNRHTRGRGGGSSRPYRFKREIPGREDDSDGQSKRPPSHLRGRDIGLWHRDRQRAKQKQQLMGPDVSLKPTKIAEIRRNLGLDAQQKNALIYEDEDDDAANKFRLDFQRIISSDLETNIKNAKQRSVEMTVDPDIDLNDRLLADLQRKQAQPEFCRMLEFRQRLPSFSKREEILQMIATNQIILIKGETGCGKTTQVAQFILDEAISAGRGGGCKIICTQPRRIAAITIAERVASERTEPLGESVGYQIRLDSVLPRSKASILYCTTGIVLKLMEGDPILHDYSHIVLDEIHERDLNSDTIIGLLKMIVGWRKDLKIVLMSATLRAEYFSEYFFQCPMLEIEGFTYKVEEKYLEDVLEETQFFDFDAKGSGRRDESHKFAKFSRNFKSQERSNADFVEMMLPYRNSLKGNYSKAVLDAIMRPESEDINVELIESLILHISRQCPPGAILVFLPGYEKISKLYNNITKSVQFPAHKFVVYPLHSMLPSAAQKSVFERPVEGVRKIILATNIAETSITIDDVVYVVNAGRLKQTFFDKDLNVQTMTEDWNTLANARQRKGRAGRVQEGVCYHLYTRAREATFQAYPTPEILRIRLENLILSLKILCVSNLKAFLAQMIDPPDEAIVEASIELLKRLKALDADEKLTPLGLHLARLPMDPQAGKMVLFAAIFGCFDSITSVAASLSFKNAFSAPIGRERDVDDVKLHFAKNSQSDHLMLANTIDEWRTVKRRDGDDYAFCRKNFLSFTVLNQLEKMKQQFCDLLYGSRFLEDNRTESEVNNLNNRNKKLLKGVILAALFPNIAYLKKVKTFRNRVDAMPLIMTYEDKSVKIHPSSVNFRARTFDSKYMTYFMKQKSSSTYIFDITVLNVYPILFFGDKIERVADENGKMLLIVGDHHRFLCDEPTAQLIMDLRSGFEHLLKMKVCEPSPTDWSRDSHEGNLLRAIIDLINIDGGDEDYESDDE